MMPSSTLSVLILTQSDQASFAAMDDPSAAFPKLQTTRSTLVNADLEKLLKQTEVIVAEGCEISSSMLDGAPSCRAVVLTGPLASTHLEAARERGIFVSRIADAATEACADAAGRWMDAFLESWEAARRNPDARTLRRRPKVGLIGLGRIGEAVARQARRRKLERWTFDPFALDDAFEQTESKRCPQIEDALGIPDLVFIQIAPAEENRHLIGSMEMEVMRSGSWLINLGWDAAIDNPALDAALTRGRPGRGLLALWESRGAEPDAARAAETGPIVSFDPVESRETEVAQIALRRALELAQLIAGNRDPHPLLIDPPLPRWSADGVRPGMAASL